jgi:Protein of unknown function (DUF998)
MTEHHAVAARRTAAYSSIVFVTVFLLLLIVLHFLEPEFNPPHFISEYELGRFGWLMSLAFFCLGMGSLCLLLALWSDLQTKGGRIGRWLLLLVSIAYIGAGVFAPDPSSIAESRLHGLSGIVVIFSSPVAFTLLWRSVIRDPHWFEVSRLLKWMTLLTWLGLLLFYGSIIIFYGLAHGFGTIVTGWANRFMIATYCAWLMIAAWQAIKFSRSKDLAETL